jgi:hypothetical protein
MGTRRISAAILSLQFESRRRRTMTVARFAPALLPAVRTRFGSPRISSIWWNTFDEILIQLDVPKGDQHRNLLRGLEMDVQEHDNILHWRQLCHSQSRYFYTMLIIIRCSPSEWVTILTINISQYESSAMVTCVSVLIREVYNTTTGDFLPFILSEVFILIAILSLFIVSICRSSECNPSMSGGGYSASVAAVPLTTFARIMSIGWDLKSIVGRKPIVFSSYNVVNKANWNQTCSQSSFKLPILARSSSGIMMDLLMIQIWECRDVVIASSRFREDELGWWQSGPWAFQAPRPTFCSEIFPANFSGNGGIQPKNIYQIAGTSSDSQKNISRLWRNLLHSYGSSDTKQV